MTFGHCGYPLWRQIEKSPLREGENESILHNEMTTITIQITDEESTRMDQIAESTGMRKEDLLKASIRDLVSGPSEDFQYLTQSIIEKNKDLYKKLA